MIYIHIGLQKTGTTSLQYFLREMDLLRFPLDPVRNIKNSDQIFYSSGNQEFFLKCRKNNLEESYFQNLSRKDIVISCENFSNPDDNLVSLNNLLKYLKRNFPKQFILICTFRDINQYCKSMYVEAVTNSFVCEMRSFEKYKRSLELYLDQLNKLLLEYPSKKFKYDINVNFRIFKYITGDNLVCENVFTNVKDKKICLGIKDLEKLAMRNMLNGWNIKYRSQLRRKYKNDILEASFIYILLTYLRSLCRFIKSFFEVNKII